MYVLSRALLLCNANESTKSLINRVVFTRDTSMQLFAHTIFYKLPGYKQAQKRGARLKNDPPCLENRIGIPTFWILVKYTNH